MKTQQLVTALIAAAGIASAAVAGPPASLAGNGSAKVSVIVSSHGLDLTTDAGADQFLERLTSAVDRACDDRANGPTLTLGHTAGFYECRSQALETAMAYVRSPVVKRRYAAMQASDSVRLARR